MTERIEVPHWALISTFRYALGRSSYIVPDTIELLREYINPLQSRGWHEKITEEIHERDRQTAPGEGVLPYRTEWLALANELTPPTPTR